MGQPDLWSSAHNDRPVLVVGAGPTGLTVAAGLVQRGIHPRLIDDALGPSQRSKALLLQPRSLEVLDDLGLVDTVIREGLPLSGLVLHVDDKDPITLDIEGIDSTYPFPLVLPQGRLEALLLDHLAERGLHVERGLRLEGLEPGWAGVEVQLGRQQGPSEQARVSYVVGCDGRYSTTRDLVGIPVEASYDTAPVILADVSLEGDLPDDQISVCIRDEGVVMATPMPSPGRFRLSIMQDAGRQVDWAPTEATLQALLDALAPGSVTLHDLAWAAQWQPDPAVAAAFQEGHVLLAGDAAHTHAPLGAQGMNSGLQDAQALTWRLAHVLRDQAAGPELVATYATERRRAAQHATTVCHRLDRLAAGSSLIDRLARRHLGAWLMERTPIRDRAARWISQTAISYPTSPLSEDHRRGILHRLRSGGDLKAGDRVPDTVLGRPDGSFDRLAEETRGPHHVLLLLAGQNDTDPAVQALTGCGEAAIEHLGSAVRVLWVQPRHDGQAHGPGGPVRFQGRHANREGQIRYRTDPEGALHQRMGADKASVCLVRPDGHLAVVQHPPQPEALAAYLARWYLPLPGAEEPETPPQATSQVPPAPRLMETWRDELEAARTAGRRRDR